RKVCWQEFRMMLLAETRPDVALLAGRLAHSWLKHQIIARDPRFVAALHTVPSDDSARVAFVARLGASGEFADNLAKCRKLAAGLVEDLSPARLLDDGPLAEMPAFHRGAIASILHDAYLAGTDIALLRDDIAIATDGLATALDKFSAAWHRVPPCQSI